MPTDTTLNNEKSNLATQRCVLKQIGKRLTRIALSWRTISLLISGALHRFVFTLSCNLVNIIIKKGINKTSNNTKSKISNPPPTLSGIAIRKEDAKSYPKRRKRKKDSDLTWLCISSLRCTPVRSRGCDKIFFFFFREGHYETQHYTSRKTIFGY